MATLVYNARGGTPEEPCPTAMWRWFRTPYCGRVDYRAWHSAARNLYSGGLVPAYQQLRSIAPDDEATQLAHAATETYRTEFTALPRDGSFISEDRNVESIAQVVLLMTQGNSAYDQIVASIEERGAKAQEPALPPPPAEPVEKRPWRRVILPGLALLGGVGLVSLVFVAGRD